jgi:hypothetical protein
MDNIPVFEGMFGFNELQTMEVDIYGSPNGSMSKVLFPVYINKLLSLYPSISPTFVCDRRGKLIRGPAILKVDSGPGRTALEDADHKDMIEQCRVRGLHIILGLPNGTMVNEECDLLFGPFKIAVHRNARTLVGRRLRDFLVRLQEIRDAQRSQKVPPEKLPFPHLDYKDIGYLVFGESGGDKSLSPFWSSFTEEKISSAFRKVGTFPCNYLCLNHEKISADFKEKDYADLKKFGVVKRLRVTEKKVDVADEEDPCLTMSELFERHLFNIAALEDIGWNTTGLKMIDLRGLEELELPTSSRKQLTPTVAVSRGIIDITSREFEELQWEFEKPKREKREADDKKRESRRDDLVREAWDIAKRLREKKNSSNNDLTALEATVVVRFVYRHEEWTDIGETTALGKEDKVSWLRDLEESWQSRLPELRPPTVEEAAASASAAAAAAATSSSSSSSSSSKAQSRKRGSGEDGEMSEGGRGAREKKTTKRYCDEVDSVDV